MISLSKSNKAVRFKRWDGPGSVVPGWSRLRSTTGALSNPNNGLNFVMVVERSRGHHTSGRSRTLGF